MLIFTKRLSPASQAIEIFCEIDSPTKCSNIRIFCEKLTRCKDHGCDTMMQNSSAWFFHFTKVRTVDFVKRCFKISRSYFTTYECHCRIISPQKRCVWLNRLRCHFYLRNRPVFKFMMASNSWGHSPVKDFFFQALTFLLKDP